MKNLLRSEELLVTVAAIYVYSFTGYPWWLLAVLFLAPDIGMLGYLAGPRVGAGTYNALHHRGLAAIVAGVGFVATLPVLQLAGVVLFAHASFDRVFGYGLKYGDSFANTHLGRIGGKP